MSSRLLARRLRCSFKCCALLSAVLVVLYGLVVEVGDWYFDDDAGVVVVVVVVVLVMLVFALPPRTDARPVCGDEEALDGPFPTPVAVVVEGDSTERWVEECED